MDFASTDEEKKKLKEEKTATEWRINRITAHTDIGSFFKPRDGTDLGLGHKDLDDFTFSDDANAKENGEDENAAAVEKVEESVAEQMEPVDEAADGEKPAVLPTTNGQVEAESAAP